MNYKVRNLTDTADTRLYCRRPYSTLEIGPHAVLDNMVKNHSLQLDVQFLSPLYIPS